MAACCKCTNGREFCSDVLEDDWTINSLVLRDEVCPECGAEFEITEINSDHYEDDVI